MATCKDCNFIGRGFLDSDGKCSECEGVGWTMNWPATFILDEEDCHLHCDECDGTGDCQACDGTGEVDDDD